MLTTRSQAQQQNQVTPTESVNAKRRQAQASMLAKGARLTTASSVELPEVAERDLLLIDIDALLQRRHGSA